MVRMLRIDRALYEVDDNTKTYRFCSRNSEWRNLGSEENERNKKQLDGYTRIFRDGARKVFRYRDQQKRRHHTA